MADPRDRSSFRSWSRRPHTRWRTPLFSAAVILGILSAGMLVELAAVAQDNPQEESSAATTSPTTEPQEIRPQPAEPRERGGRRGDRDKFEGEFDRGDRGFDRRGRDDSDDPDRREPTEDEWAQTVQFLEEHAPRRLALYRSWMERFRQRQEAREGEDAENQDQRRDGEREGSERRPSIRAHIFHRIEMMRRLQEKDPSLYRFALKQFELEDQIIGGLQDVREAQRAEDQDALTAAEGRVDAALRQYLENALEERRERIAHLERELAREKQRLSHDEENMDELMQRLQRRFARYLPPDERRERRDGSSNRDDGEHRRSF